MTEEWKDIEGYEGLYQVSDLGRIKSLARVVSLGYGRLKMFKERIKYQREKRGYMYVKLAKSGTVTTYLVHRLVATHFKPIHPGRDQVNHLNFDGTDNRAVNLKWSTRSENQIYSMVNGRGAYGKSGWDIQSRKKAAA